MSIPVDNQIIRKSRPGVSILDFDRKVLLEIVSKKTQGKNVKAAYAFGSFSKENEHYWSDIDLIIIHDTTAPFIERPREFFDLMDVGIPFDILVYTPVEFQKLQDEKIGFWKEVQENLLQII